MAHVNKGDRWSIMNWSEIRHFWWRRVIRIYPLHFAVLLAMLLFNFIVTVFLMQLGHPPPTFWSSKELIMLGAQFLLINAWLPLPNAWNIPSWSISAEFVAYAIFPLLVWGVVKTRRTTTIILLAACASFYTFAASGPSLDITGGASALGRCLAGFTLGFLLHGQRDLFNKLPDLSLNLMQLATVIWIVAAMSVPSRDSLVIPAFVFLVGLTWCDRGVVARLLGVRKLLWLGEISYAIYIGHLLILGVLSFIWDRTFRHVIHDMVLERSIFILSAYAAVIIIAAICNKRLELPLRLLLSTAMSTQGRVSARGVTTGRS